MKKERKKKGRKKEKGERKKGIITNTYVNSMYKWFESPSLLSSPRAQQTLQEGLSLERYPADYPTTAPLFLHFFPTRPTEVPNANTNTSVASTKMY